jgi:hypothetical protein
LFAKNLTMLSQDCAGHHGVKVLHEGLQDFSSTLTKFFRKFLKNMDTKNMTQTVLCLWVFCPFGRFVPKDILSHGCYVSGCFVSRTFCLTDVLFAGCLSHRRFCPCMLCLWTFCLGTVYIYISTGLYMVLTTETI